MSPDILSLMGALLLYLFFFWPSNYNDLCAFLKRKFAKKAPPPPPFTEEQKLKILKAAADEACGPLVIEHYKFCAPFEKLSHIKRDAKLNREPIGSYIVTTQTIEGFLNEQMQQGNADDEE